MWIWPVMQFFRELLENLNLVFVNLACNAIFRELLKNLNLVFVNLACNAIFRELLKNLTLVLCEFGLSCNIFVNCWKNWLVFVKLAWYAIFRELLKNMSLPLCEFGHRIWPDLQFFREMLKNVTLVFMWIWPVMQFFHELIRNLPLVFYVKLACYAIFSCLVFYFHDNLECCIFFLWIAEKPVFHSQVEKTGYWKISKKLKILDHSYFIFTNCHCRFVFFLYLETHHFSILNK